MASDLDSGAHKAVLTEGSEMQPEPTPDIQHLGRRLEVAQRDQLGRFRLGAFGQILLIPPKDGMGLVRFPGKTVSDDFHGPADGPHVRLRSVFFEPKALVQP
jgi:hypothetical protein